MGGQKRVTDKQIIGALAIAHEVWSLELEVVAKLFCWDEEGQEASNVD